MVERVGRIAEVRADPAASRSTITAGLVAMREIEAWCAAQHAGLVGQLRAVDSFPEKTIADTSKTSLGQASTTTERSTTLDATPRLADALENGAITAGHIDALTRNVAFVRPDEDLHTVMRRFAALRQEVLPVIAGEPPAPVIGLLRHHDVMEAYDLEVQKLRSAE